MHIILYYTSTLRRSRVIGDYELRSHQVRSYGLFLEKSVCFVKDVKNKNKRLDST
jgi:hypothetical protein